MIKNKRGAIAIEAHLFLLLMRKEQGDTSNNLQDFVTYICPLR
jgi:hypothetical protein